MLVPALRLIFVLALLVRLHKPWRLDRTDFARLDCPAVARSDGTCVPRRDRATGTRSSRMAVLAFALGDDTLHFDVAGGCAAECVVVERPIVRAITVITIGRMRTDCRERGLPLVLARTG